MDTWERHFRDKSIRRGKARRLDWRASIIAGSVIAAIVTIELLILLR